MPALLVSTMPSGSTRVTVASLYSFPVTVLKSSACATEMNDRIKTVRSFVFTCLNQTLLFCSHIWDSLVKENSSPNEAFRAGDNSQKQSNMRIVHEPTL